MSSELDRLCTNTIRALSIDGVQQASSGHPGLPLGAAAMAYVVWTKFLRHNPANPAWVNRDRFVLSAGHGSMLLYSLLHLTGYDLSLDELKNFRQWGSRTPGHPESHLTPGVEATTGPLGQGVGNIVGMAIAREHLAARFNSPGRELISYRVFGICSDGDLMEGVAAEAASLAGHLALGNIVLLYDDNRVTIDGRTDITFTEDVAARFTAYGWSVLRADGLDTDAVSSAVESALAQQVKPTLVICRTTIGFGSPNKADSPKVHGSPLGEEEVKLTKRALGFPESPPFHVPNEVSKYMRTAIARGATWERDWNADVAKAKAESAAFAREWDTFWSGEFPTGWDANIPVWTAKDKPIATRKASEIVLNALAPRLPWLIGGSADLAESNLTYLKDLGDFQRDHRSGRNLRFGIREHGMGAILNGIALTKPLRPFGSTFLAFLDYMKPAVRLAALSHLPVIYVFTHDSIGLGEDGPTHQPVEQLWSLRATPNTFVFRPADANETAACWKLALLRTEGPSALVLSRQALPVIDRERCLPMQVERGGYVLSESGRAPADIILLATGSEVALALGAQAILESEGIAARVVSMPCLELFDRQPEDYRKAVLPPDAANRLAIEAGSPVGWWKYAGSKGDVVGIERFGASAPADVLFEKFGFTAENVAARAKALVLRNRQP